MKFSTWVFGALFLPLSPLVDCSILFISIQKLHLCKLGFEIYGE